MCVLCNLHSKVCLLLVSPPLPPSPKLVEANWCERFSTLDFSHDYSAHILYATMYSTTATTLIISGHCVIAFFPLNVRVLCNLNVRTPAIPKIDVFGTVSIHASHFTDIKNLEQLKLCAAHLSKHYSCKAIRFSSSSTTVVAIIHLIIYLNAKRWLLCRDANALATSKKELNFLLFPSSFESINS